MTDYERLSFLWLFASSLRAAFLLQVLGQLFTMCVLQADNFGDGEAGLDVRMGNGIL